MRKMLFKGMKLREVSAVPGADHCQGSVILRYQQGQGPPRSGEEGRVTFVSSWLLFRKCPQSFLSNVHFSWWDAPGSYSHLIMRTWTESLLSPPAREAEAGPAVLLLRDPHHRACLSFPWFCSSADGLLYFHYVILFPSPTKVRENISPGEDIFFYWSASRRGIV